MAKSSYTHVSLSSGNRQQLRISNFGGVDYTTQKFLISQNHAIDEKNYIFKDEVVQLRNGYEEIAKIGQYRYIAKSFKNNAVIVQEVIDNVIQPQSKRITRSVNLLSDTPSYESNQVKVNGTTVNGMWNFVGEDGKEHLIAHIGSLLYLGKDINKETIEFNPIVSNENKVVGSDGLSYNLCFEFLDRKSHAFVGGNKLWFLGGTQYMCIRFLPVNTQTSTLRLFSLVDSEITPIPTTTISITYLNAKATNRQTYDAVNLLTKWRYNKMITGVGKAEDEKNKTPYFDYTLDSPIYSSNFEKDMANFHITLEERGKING